MVVAPGGELIAHGDPDKKALVAQTRNMSGHQLFAAAPRAHRRDAGVAGIHRRGRPQPARRRRADRAARLDRDRRAADPRSLRQRHRAAAPARRRHLARAARDDRRRLFLRPQLHQPDPHAAARHARHRRRPARRARLHPTATTSSAISATRSTRWPIAWSKLQEEVKRQERQAMFGRVAAGLVHDLVAPDPEHRQQHAAAAARRPRRRIARSVPPHDRARAADAQALHGRPAPRRQAEADRALRDGRQRLGRRDRRVDARRRRAQRRHRRGAVRAGTAGHRRRPLRARPRLPQPDHQRDPGHRAGRPRHHRDRRAPAIRSRSASPTPAPAFRPIGSSAIFDDFVTTKRRGLGLGLAISKRIVEQLDGTIDVAERSRTRHGVHAALPGARRSPAQAAAS